MITEWESHVPSVLVGLGECEMLGRDWCEHPLSSIWPQIHLLDCVCIVLREIVSEALTQ